METEPSNSHDQTPVGTAENVSINGYHYYFKLTRAHVCASAAKLDALNQKYHNALAEVLVLSPGNGKFTSDVQKILDDIEVHRKIVSDFIRSKETPREVEPYI